MQVALHFGAPFTDENRLQLCLGKNREALAEVGTFIPRPSSFRRNLRPTLNRIQDGEDTLTLRQEFLSEVMGDSQADRIVFSFNTFMGIPRLIISQDEFYRGPMNRMHNFVDLFNNAEVELFFALRNPATFIQELLIAHPNEGLDFVAPETDPSQLRWSLFIERLKQFFPQVPLTVWCNEDTPMIWEEIIREIAGVDPLFKIDGGTDLLQEIMTAEGYGRLIDYLEVRPNLTSIQKRRVIAAFLEKFAADDALEEELDIPGWTDEYVEELTEIYDEDVYEIQRIPGVNFITP